MLQKFGKEGGGGGNLGHGKNGGRGGGSSIVPCEAQKCKGGGDGVRMTQEGGGQI